MRITDCVESRERCAESGWYAYDYLLDAPLTKEDIMGLKEFGSFVYLGMLKQPFFKVENDYYILKGILGNDYFRIAVHGKHGEAVDQIRSKINLR